MSELNSSVSSKRVHYICFFVIAILGATVDIFTKDLVWIKLNCNQNNKGNYVVVRNEQNASRNYLQFNCTTNPGIIFGLFAKYRNFFFVVTLLAIPIIILIFVTLRKYTWTFTLALGFILAGTFGNVFDRVKWKSVRDFIDFQFIQWPIFNLADAFILAGMFILTLEMLLFDDDPSPEQGVNGSVAPTLSSDQNLTDAGNTNIR